MHFGALPIYLYQPLLLGPKNDGFFRFFATTLGPNFGCEDPLFTKKRILMKRPSFKGCQECLSDPRHSMSGRPAGRPSRSLGLCFSYKFVRQKATFFILSAPPFHFERACVGSSTVTLTQKCVKFVDFNDEA